MLDTVIIGGSSAGLSAALILGRSLRNVVVLDDQKPCNRFTHASHGFLTQDGTAPAQLLQTARDQLAPYATVTLKSATAVTITATAHGFTVLDASGQAHDARTVLLATGLHDALPALEGIEPLWGKSVFHCPYCDGYEVCGKAVAVYGTDEAAMHLLLLMRNLTPALTLVTGGLWQPTPEQREKIASLGIRLAETPVSRLESTDSQIQAIRFADGSTLACDALFIRPKTSHRTPFAHDLGCQMNVHQVVQVDLRGRTSVAGVYAAGDLSSPIRSVAIAVAQGAAAGYGINADLVEQGIIGDMAPSAEGR
ncbi:MAG: NAD(P)/FAD-dependent oxidoreductase [Pleurocapsa minor GSE-CHR-MK-17-07R]|jgi:thioredoxin reductase|nr:NAD(P)/FAD-dependent oxidoreductase [Pleurocapsa minor GSE-CHR-MK 17-07R]